jgi:hypothetical protein
MTIPRTARQPSSKLQERLEQSIKKPRIGSMRGFAVSNAFA